MKGKGPTGLSSRDDIIISQILYPGLSSRDDSPAPEKKVGGVEVDGELLSPTSRVPKFGANNFLVYGGPSIHGDHK